MERSAASSGQVARPFGNVMKIQVEELVDTASVATVLLPAIDHLLGTKIWI